MLFTSYEITLTTVKRIADDEVENRTITAELSSVDYVATTLGAYRRFEKTARKIFKEAQKAIANGVTYSVTVQCFDYITKNFYRWECEGDDGTSEGLYFRPCTWGGCNTPETLDLFVPDSDFLGALADSGF